MKKAVLARIEKRGEINFHQKTNKPRVLYQQFQFLHHHNKARVNVWGSTRYFLPLIGAIAVSARCSPLAGPTLRRQLAAGSFSFFVASACCRFVIAITVFFPESRYGSHFSVYYFFLLYLLLFCYICCYWLLFWFFHSGFHSISFSYKTIKSKPGLNPPRLRELAFTDLAVFTSGASTQLVASCCCSASLLSRLGVFRWQYRHRGGSYFGFAIQFEPIAQDEKRESYFIIDMAVFISDVNFFIIDPAKRKEKQGRKTEAYTITVGLLLRFFSGDLPSSDPARTIHTQL
ncbi:hypothetical protein M9H77_27445 [Catharanthus roseus]|uniref:Uncharacterized protein n=1 Tax=Catharanthus roseus TaxID=4058 RepID=A0ACC0AF77_CATRO|nr:hypothetical protein M9H77_27445 [Catharanthus roseus]